MMDADRERTVSARLGFREPQQRMAQKARREPTVPPARRALSVWKALPELRARQVASEQTAMRALLAPKVPRADSFRVTMAPKTHCPVVLSPVAEQRAIRAASVRKAQMVLIRSLETGRTASLPPEPRARPQAELKAGRFLFWAR
jgi:hypothetical protein